tara:strand:+ start:787 stop:1044 length:258 start_codon:yes stop_codon:yes gene_type:complete
MKNLFLYSIVSLIVYVNIKNYLINKNKFIQIFDSICGINKKIENIEKFINRKKVQFKNDKTLINRTNSYNSLDIDENNYSSSEEN